jgi:hypothetical protein
MSKYGVVEVSQGKWKVTENGRIWQSPLGPDIWFSEDLAHTYAIMWNHWGSPYDRNNPRCLEPLGGEIMHQLYNIKSQRTFDPEEEDEDRIAPDEETAADEQLPIQQSLW